MVLDFALLTAGLMAGFRKRENLVYLFFIAFPLLSLRYFKYGNIKIAIVFEFLCLLPAVFFIILDGISCLRGIKGSDKDLMGIFLTMGAFMVFIYVQYQRSLLPGKLDQLEVLAIGFVVFIYTLQNYKHIDCMKLIGITRVIVLLEAFIGCLQALGVPTGQMLPFVDDSYFNPQLVKLSWFSRAVGTFYDPNYFALYMAALSAALVRYSKGIGASLVFFIGIAGILSSFSRMGAILAIILLAAYFCKRLNFNSKTGVLFSIITVTALAVSVVYLYLSYDKYPVVNIIIQRFSQNDQFGMRGMILEIYFRYVVNLKNIFLGLGFENFEYFLYEQTGIFMVAHNQYIQILADIGVCGYLFIAAIILIILNRSNIREHIVKNPFVLTIIVLLLGNMALTTTYYPFKYLYYALFSGFILSMKGVGGDCKYE